MIKKYFFCIKFCLFFKNSNFRILFLLDFYIFKKKSIKLKYQLFLKENYKFIKITYWIYNINILLLIFYIKIPFSKILKLIFVNIYIEVIKISVAKLSFSYIITNIYNKIY